ncbi:MAG: CinA family protein [Erysipelothrix sp.]|nr:CinA family protein [Erysipelothrix sp.]
MKPKYFERFIALDLTLASAESITGGQFAASITAYAGASQFYLGGTVVYNDDIKHRILHVSKSDLKRYKAISKEVALQLANHTLKTFQSDVAIAFVGNAGPTAQDQQPVGKCFMAIVSKEMRFIYEDNLGGDRNSIQTQCVALADQRLNKYLDHKEAT